MPTKRTNPVDAIELEVLRQKLTGETREQYEARESLFALQQYDNAARATRDARESLTGRRQSNEEMMAEVRARHNVAHATERAHTYRDSFTGSEEYHDSWLRQFSKRSLNGHEQEVLSAGSFRDLSDITGASGGYSVPASFRALLQRALLNGSPMRQVATVIETPTGRSFPMPYTDNTSQAATRLAENVAITPQDVVFNAVTLSAWPYVSSVRFPWSLAEDAGVDLEANLAQILADKVNRGQEGEFVTGTGVSQPLGLPAATTVGVTTASNATITFAEYEAAFFSLRPSYRQGGAVWQMNSSTLKAAWGLLDLQNRPVFDHELGTILGLRVVCNDQYAAIGSTNVVATVGRHDLAYVIRDVSPPTSVVLRERYADSLESAAIFCLRTDASVLDPAACRSIKMHV